MTSSEAIDDFVAALAKTRQPGTFNPWRQSCRHDLGHNTPAARAERLRLHLSAPQPRLLLIGEAPGYQGCRYSGIPFVSEYLLLEGAIPRVTTNGRLTDRKLPFREPSATIIWETLHATGIAASTVLWNAVPWHPMGDTPLSNRSPTAHELERGQLWLRRFIDLFPDARTVALGRHAERALRTVGVAAPYLRHPSHGGAERFRTGLKQLVAGETAADRNQAAGE